MATSFQAKIAELQEMYRSFDSDEVIEAATIASRELKKCQRAFSRDEIPHKAVQEARADFYAIEGLKRQLTHTGGY